MDKKLFLAVLNDAGYELKSSQIKSIEIISTREHVNSVNAILHAYRVLTKAYEFTFKEELVPNKYGSTAFSTETKLTLCDTKAITPTEEETEIGDEITADITSEDM